MLEQDILAAFTPEWETLGVIASRVGVRSGQKLVRPARDLRDRGLVESKFNGACLSWRRSVEADAPSADDLAPPPKLTPYCPPVELEGPHSGLVEQLAQRLWSKARSYSRAAVVPVGSWEDRPEWVKMAWRDVAHDALMMMFDLGFTGPAGEPKADRFEGLSYCWNYIASEWQVNDAEGGYVALVRETPDLEIMLAAPAMRSAILGLFDSLPAKHPIRDNPQVAELAAALPENQSHKEKANAN